MQNTTNLNLKKPDYTDFADIQDINDNMDALDDAIHDTQNSVATFTSSDVADGSATSWTTVPKVDSGETHKSIFAKMSQMFKNIRFLYKMLGTTDISSIGNGTVTGGLSSLNSSLEWMQITDGITDGIRAYRWGKVVFMSFEGVTLTRNVSANNPFSSVPMSYVPAYSVSFKDSLSNKRIVIEHVTGYIFCTEALTSGTNLRGFMTYLTN